MAERGIAWHPPAAWPGLGRPPQYPAGEIDVVVGLTSAGWDEESEDGLPGAVWYRTRR